MKGRGYVRKKSVIVLSSIENSRVLHKLSYKYENIYESVFVSQFLITSSHERRKQRGVRGFQKTSFVNRD